MFRGKLKYKTTNPCFKAGWLMVLICTHLGSTAQITKHTDEDAVEAAVEQLRLVMITPNKTILENLAADELSYGHSSGTIRDKQGFVHEFVKGWSVFRSISFSGQTVQLVGDVAIVRHRLTGETFNKNVPDKIDILILLVWQKQKDTWKLLARQAAKIPE